MAKQESRPTLKTIAEKAGVSAVTVSVALNPSGRSHARVSEATRRKIQKIAEDLNFKPHALASHLRRKEAGRIGFAADRLIDLSNNELKARVLGEAVQRGVVLHQFNYDSRTPNKDLLSDLLAQDLDHLIVFRFWDRLSPDEKRALGRRFPGRLLVVGHFDREDMARHQVSFLHADLVEARRHLLLRMARTHRRIAVLTYQFSDGGGGGGSPANPIPPSAHFTDRRPELWRVLAMELGPVFRGEDDVFPCNVYDPEAVYRTSRRILDLGYDAVHVHHDQAVPMVYKAVADAKRSIPRDMGVTGLDDLYFSAWLNPPLTTIRVDGALVVEGIFDWLRKPWRERKIPAVLMERESLKP